MVWRVGFMSQRGMYRCCKTKYLLGLITNFIYVIGKQSESINHFSLAEAEAENKETKGFYCMSGIYDNGSCYFHMLCTIRN